MSDGQRSPLLAYLRRLSPAATVEGDAHLLTRFIETRDEAAFTSLLRRHGPLVWSVCRRVLAEEHAAEDAFQATFLVLVRKASSVSKKASLRSWLYGVALRVALRARQRENLRNRREQETPIRPPNDAATWNDVRPILDEEIQRLPEKYRLPVLLCYLEGRTNDEAAQQLNCPRGTIATRLARARERLRARLIRRGVTLSATAFAAQLADNGVSAVMPPLFAALSARTVLCGATSVSITNLSDGVLRMMYVTKALAVLVGIAFVLVAGGVGAFAVSMQRTPPPAKEEESRPRAAVRIPEKKTDTLDELMQERLKIAKQEMEVIQALLKRGTATPEELVSVSQRLLRAQIDLCSSKDARIAALQRHVKTMEQFAGWMEGAHKSGLTTKNSQLMAQYAFVDAKIELEREKAR